MERALKRIFRVTRGTSVLIFDVIQAEQETLKTASFMVFLWDRAVVN